MYKQLVISLSLLLSNHIKSLAQQMLPAKERECIDIILTKAGRVFNCRIDAAFTNLVYFSVSPTSPYKETYLPKDSIASIWSESSKSKKAFQKQTGYPVQTDPPPDSYRNKRHNLKTTKIIVLAEFGISYSYILGENTALGPFGNIISEIRRAPQYMGRIAVIGHSKIGGYIWLDGRNKSASEFTRDGEYSLTYTYTNLGAGFAALVPLSNEKDIGYFSSNVGLGYGRVHASKLEPMFSKTSFTGTGVIFDFSLGATVSIAKKLQLGADMGYQKGTATVETGNGYVEEDLTRFRLGGKVGIIF